MDYPIYKSIEYHDPAMLFANFAEWDGAIFLDSAALRENCGRYSYILVDPFLKLSCKNGLIDCDGRVFEGNPFEVLSDLLKKYSLQTHPTLPPFQGGIAGLFSYDLYQYLEKIPKHAIDDMHFPDLAVGFYDVMIAYDHEKKLAWIIANGFPSHDREKYAKQRIAWMEAQCAIITKQSEFTLFKEMHSFFSEESYQAAVKKVIDYILAGDIFEANISQRFIADIPKNFSNYALYLKLREVNPAPFAAFLKFSDMVLLSASPERFLQLIENHVETRPIKGTRPRGATLEEDNINASDLLLSVKDSAENIMIVDLLRNDLSKVCEPHSVKVTQLCGLESYASVHHLVSVVCGTLKSEHSALDLLNAAFPGGSITGAPKIRAMEIIAEIEPTARGPYCGSIGYIGFNGAMDTSIVIRTFALNHEKITFQAGGAIVLDSDPLEEYLETLVKARVLKNITSPV